MEHVLPPLPYRKDALELYMSEETFDFHYGKHHQNYLTALNKLIPGTEFANLPLETIVKKASGVIFNNAAQVWNHSFFWQCLSPDGGGRPTGKLGDAINKKWGGYDGFKEAFTKAALTLFGSGWVWLVKQSDNSIDLMQTSNAGNPLTEGKQPLLTLDVWEHAYYIDYRNERSEFVRNFWKIINWRFVEENFEG